MTEQEKQPLSELEVYKIWVARLELDLIERDREVEELKEQRELLLQEAVSYVEKFTFEHKENQRLRKENELLQSILNGEFSGTEEEIDQLLGFKRQALSGEEKG